MEEGQDTVEALGGLEYMEEVGPWDTPSHIHSCKVVVKLNKN